MYSTRIQYLFVFHSTCYICDSRMISIGQLIVVETNSISLLAFEIRLHN